MPSFSGSLPLVLKRGTRFQNHFWSFDEILEIVKLCKGTPSDLRLVTKDFNADTKESGGRSALSTLRKCNSVTLLNGTSFFTVSVAENLNMYRMVLRE